MAKKIYILEDDQGILDVVDILLTEASYEVYAYPTVNAFHSSNLIAADLFLLDVMLPDGNGIEVCNELRGAHETASTPILMMSAHADFSKMSTHCKANGFIYKPFDIEYFLGMIKQELG